MKGILDSWGVDPFYLFVVMFIIQIVMIVLYVMLNTKYRRLQKSYVTFMRGKNGKNLEKSIFGKFDELDEIAELVRKIEKEQYLGMCEDSKIGISLIFTVQNGIEYMRERQAGFPADPTTSVTLSGLALSGMILLPVSKDEKSVRSEKEASDNRKMLINAARNGDQSAIETLTLDDIDMYSQVSKRLANEDIFSIVDTYFMPYGIECDLYSIMGEILAVRRRKNIVTNREVYQMKLNVNELQFDICVPVSETMGEPEIGRRFKGTIWLQGYINF